jgi:uncharacterized protein YdaU (DUF1376 family)
LITFTLSMWFALVLAPRYFFSANHMAKDPAFLFYTNDFQSGTQFFTDEQVGIYLRLLMAQHQHGHLTEKQVLIICKTLDTEVMQKFEKDGEGKYYNLKLENLINTRKSFTESRRSNRLGKKNKKKKTSKTLDKLVEDENENIIVFELFYNEYPRKVGKLDAERAWKKLNNKERGLAIDALKWWFHDVQEKFYPYPASWLNGRRWEDEKIKPVQDSDFLQ